MTKSNLRDKMRKRREDLKNRASGGNMVFFKEGTLRIRIISQGDEEEFMKEVTYFYLGEEIKGVISPDTFDEPCAILDAYNELKGGDEEDKELAKNFSPKRKQVMLVLVYKDKAGKEIDEQRSGKLALIPSNDLAQEIIDYYLDEDDWNNMLDLNNGYDLKIIRTGTTKTDTSYSVQPCFRSKVPAAARKYWKLNLDEEVRKVIPSYEETKEKISEFLKIDVDDLTEGNSKKKSSHKSSMKNKIKKPIKKIHKK